MIPLKSSSKKDCKRKNPTIIMGANLKERYEILNRLMLIIYTIEGFVG